MQFRQETLSWTKLTMLVQECVDEAMKKYLIGPRYKVDYVKGVSYETTRILIQEVAAQAHLGNTNVMRMSNGMLELFPESFVPERHIMLLRAETLSELLKLAVRTEELRITL